MSYEGLKKSIWVADPNHPEKEKVDVIQLSKFMAILNGTEEKVEALKILESLGIKYKHHKEKQND